VQAIRKINNNAAICLDSAGRMLVALGNGVGFGAMPHEVPLKDIQHTFYAVDSKYLDLIQELPQQEFEFAANLVNWARGILPYEMSPNLPITLADHIAFAVKRAREGMYINMPLASDVRAQYPREYELGEMAVRRMSHEFKVRVPRTEASGIAMHFVNAAMTAEGDAASLPDDDLLQGVVAIVERDMGIKLEKNTFDFARFATHVNYLLDRLREGNPFDTRNRDLIAAIRKEMPREVDCAEHVAAYLEEKLDVEVIDEEKIYVAMHITRVCDRLVDGS